VATCPNCGGYLERDHRCKGLWRLRLRYWATIGFGGLCAGAIAFVTFMVLDEHLSLVAVGLSILIGMVIARAFLHGGP
jgi:hypothetical protein